MLQQIGVVLWLTQGHNQPFCNGTPFTFISKTVYPSGRMYLPVAIIIPKPSKNDITLISANVSYWLWRDWCQACLKSGRWLLVPLGCALLSQSQLTPGGGGPDRKKRTGISVNKQLQKISGAFIARSHYSRNETFCRCSLDRTIDSWA